jgi:NAD+ diphosphatase
MRVCTNPDCGQLHFPRTNPAIIVLVALRERCLLGRQATWPEGLYATIAGFVEPGESLEEAVVREVREETGIEVREVTYHSSQPWPFPSSIMLGFTAQAGSDHIQLNDGELEDARWFSREEIARGVEEGWLRLPSSVSISYRLIEDWYDGEERGKKKPMIEIIG